MFTKRYLTPFLIVAIVLSFSPSVFSATSSFSDLSSSHANYDAIEYLRVNNVVKGYADGTFRPDLTINRAEFLKIVMEASGRELGGQNCYPDVRDEWFAKYVCKAKELGFVKGYSDGKFRPGQEINFAEASKIIVNILGLSVGAGTEIWYQGYVEALDAEDAIPATIPAFDHKITRGDMAEMIWRIQADPDFVTTVSYVGLKRRALASSSGDGLQHFSSCVDLQDYLGENSQIDDRTFFKDAMPLAAPTAESSDGLGGVDTTAVDYSSTNVQVAGVDEADIVKNDGKYIYVLKDNTVRIVQAYPPTGMVELSAVTFGDEGFYPTDMYVDSNRLVVTGTDYDYEEPYRIGSPTFISGSVTKVFIFDISVRENVKLFRELSFEGDYSSSRKIGNMVYVVMNKYEYFYGDPQPLPLEELVPLYSDGGFVQPVDSCTSIWYPPGVNSNQYLVIAGIPVDSADANIDKEVILGSSGEIYASTQNLYVAEPKFQWFWIMARDTDTSDDFQGTLIHKFSLGRNNLNYLGKGQVEGQILNQFSMDEHEGNFRIATTKGEVWNTSELSTNNLYVLNSSLKQIGAVENIAPGESIYSVRFMGDRAYMVTFKKIDPFFVIDLSTPSAPKILGHLKIPGYSAYLHPYDENHIIGFGKEAVDAAEGEGFGFGEFAWYQGLKIGMFDVTNVAEPKELFKTIIGDRGTDSELLYNHKALLFDKNKGIMSFPVTLAEIPESVKNDPNTPASTYGDIVFQGAYVYDVNLTDGFNLRGRITHYEENEVSDRAGYYWSGMKDIMRALYIGDYLYTVSSTIVMANNLLTLDEVNSLELEE